MQTSFLLLSLGVCLIVILILSIKLYLIRKSADEIKDAFADRLKNETNTLIDISGNDAHMRTLASSINEELKALRTLRHKYGKVIWRSRTPSPVFLMISGHRLLPLPVILIY